MASSERIFRLLDTPIDEDWTLAEAAKGQASSAEPASGGSPPRDRGEGAKAAHDLRIEFENVWFAYEGENWVLRDVNLTIEPGETLAVVGHTGAGKTTLTHLLLRFYEPQQGRIRVGGRDLADWPVNSLRRQFGVVLQEPHLFSGTVEQNIRLGDPLLPAERIRQVAREVNLHESIESLVGVSDSARRAWQFAVVGPTAARQLRPGAGARPPHLDSRRGDLQRRPTNRREDSRHGTPPADGSHVHRHCASPFDHQALRPHRRLAQGGDSGGRRSRRAPQATRDLLEALPTAVP